MKHILMTLSVVLFMSLNAFAADLTVKSGHMDFLMDAPIEKIKGKTEALSGNIHFEGEDYKTAKGTLKMDLSKIVTYTFEDDGKNTTQTAHMLNWFEIGNEVPQATRSKFQDATLVVKSVTSVVKKSETESVIEIEGDLTVHGITKKKVIELDVKKTSTGYAVVTVKPFPVKLADHDVKPRDLAGKLLQQALSAMVDKVAEEALVSIKVNLE